MKGWEHPLVLGHIDPKDILREFASQIPNQELTLVVEGVINLEALTDNDGWDSLKIRRLGRLSATEIAMNILDEESWENLMHDILCEDPEIFCTDPDPALSSYYQVSDIDLYLTDYLREHHPNSEYLKERGYLE